MSAPHPFPSLRAAPRGLAWPGLSAALLSLALSVVALSPGCGDNATPASTPEPDAEDDGLDAGDDAGGLPTLVCVPDLDGVIEADEMNAVIGVAATYNISPEGTQRTVDILGEAQDDGTRRWDWSRSYADDVQARLAADTLEGKWYAERFPDGDFVAPFDPEGTLHAVYSKDERFFKLLGIASAEEAPAEGQTLLIYTTPVELYAFPIEVGQSLVRSSDVSDATLRGVPYAGRDLYEVEVDAMGEMVLEDVTFQQVLRVRTRVSIQPIVGDALIQQQVSYLTECFGEIARATSPVGEQDPNFTEAESMRRLAIPE